MSALRAATWDVDDGISPLESTSGRSGAAVDSATALPVRRPHAPACVNTSPDAFRQMMLRLASLPCRDMCGQRTGTGEPSRRRAHN